MNPHDPRHPWSRLTAAARQLPDERDTSAPYGFSTRVAALAFQSGRIRVASLLERFSLGAIAVAGLLALLSVAVNYPALQGTAVASRAMEEDILAVDDAVSIVLDFSAD